MNVIGVDIGGTKIAAGLVRFPGGEASLMRTRPTLPSRGGEAVLRDVEELIEEIATKSPSPVATVGLGICELVSPEGTILTRGCVDWKTDDVLEKLSRFGPIHIEADVRAAALAEALFGAGKNARTFLYVTIGTGISSCLVIDGVPLTGAHGATGTLASGRLPIAGRPLEAFASGPGLAAEHGKAPDSQGVFDAAQRGDARAIEVIQAGANAVGAAIGWLINVVDPEIVVLGGGLGLRLGLYRESLIGAARDHIWWRGHRELPIVSAQAGTSAGVIGAAAGAWQKLEKRK